VGSDGRSRRSPIGAILLYNQPVPSNVRVSSVGDSHAMGRGRLKIKLAAIAYVCSLHGVDASVDRTRVGLVGLHIAAFEYYEELTGTDPRARPAEPLHNAKITHKLALAAMAYVNARHGVDADAGLSRAGLALLCSVAIEYCESIAGADPRKRPVDPHLQIDNGV
jgi:hypothetical protein